MQQNLNNPSAVVPHGPVSRGAFDEKRDHPTCVQNAVQKPGRLSAAEKHDLDVCEGAIQHGLGYFFEVGAALVMIRDSQLYRAEYSTFEQYCRHRWNIGRSYACRVLGATERLKLLPSDTTIPVPANEFQSRRVRCSYCSGKRKRYLQLGDNEKALATVERIEELLFES